MDIFWMCKSFPEISIVWKLKDVSFDNRQCNFGIGAEFTIDVTSMILLHHFSRCAITNSDFEVVRHQNRVPDKTSSRRNYMYVLCHNEKHGFNCLSLWLRINDWQIFEVLHRTYNCICWLPIPMCRIFNRFYHLYIN